MRMAQTLFRYRRSVRMFFSLLCCAGSTEGQHNKETYCEAAEGSHGELPCTDVRKSRGSQAQRRANRIKSQSSHIPISPSNYKGARNGLLEARGEVLGGWSATLTLSRLWKGCRSYDQNPGQIWFIHIIAGSCF